MFYTSGISTHFDLPQKVYQFMQSVYPSLKNTDIEVIHTDLTEDNVFGWTLENNDQNEIEIHDNLTEKDYITTLIHELVHVDQNLRGLRDDTERETEAYKLETPLTNQFLNVTDH
tara:strand:- start:43 stop:387 length:345 start_codon:yes stop_codon:yes gene_type:complete